MESHWRPKSESVRSILRSWNIGADSVVFVDDSPMEVAEATAAFPEMEGIVFPAEDEHAVYDLLERLRDLFGKTFVAEEDRLRAASLRNAPRALEAAQTDPEEFLARAEANIAFAYNAPDQRSLELINKTNQFNLNGRRLDETQWKLQLADPSRFLHGGFVCGQVRPPRQDRGHVGPERSSGDRRGRLGDELSGFFAPHRASDVAGAVR